MTFEYDSPEKVVGQVFAHKLSFIADVLARKGVGSSRLLEYFSIKNSHNQYSVR